MKESRREEEDIKEKRKMLKEKENAVLHLEL
jgi:hypothetical protein